MENKKNKHMFLWIYLVGVAGLVLLDQITKIIAEKHLYNQKPFVIIDGVFEFSYLRNEGAAWGLFSGQRVFFLIITVVLFIVVSYVVFRMPSIQKMIPLEMFCVLLGAGAIGNFIDRLLFGYVRDFVYFKLINFPVFNVADCYVTVSVILFIILVFFIYKESDMEFLKLSKENTNQENES